MDSLIPVINKLQDVFSTLGEDIIELPQIVVIGAQSSGKSSVLESLVGRPFLPRGVGMVTRCPIILQLIYAPMDDREHRSSHDGTLELQEWCKFLHKPDKIFTDFDEVQQEIEEEAERNAGSHKGICTKSVNLQVYSAGVVSLTVVDLPGMVQMPVDNQPLDIKDQIYNLLMTFVKNPNSIILAISPANVDIATSESLKLAKEVDPEGKRTLAVITKLDLMDKGTDAMDVLAGRVVPVKLGIIGVVNRSHQDNQDRKSIEDSLKAEANFLQRKYVSIASKNGTRYLAKTLNQLLIAHINTCLPGLKKRVDDYINLFQTELDSYGLQVKDAESQRQNLLRIITNFSTFYNSAIVGDSGDGEVETKEARGGARISYLIHERFDNDIMTIDPIIQLTDLDILLAIRNASGIRRVLLVPEGTFENLVKIQIKRLKDPSLRCVRSVHTELQRIVQDCWKQIEHEMIRFPGIHKSISNVVMELLGRRLPIVQKRIENLISDQLAYINKRHPEFVREIEEFLHPVAPVAQVVPVPVLAEKTKHYDVWTQEEDDYWVGPDGEDPGYSHNHTSKHGYQHIRPSTPQQQQNSNITVNGAAPRLTEHIEIRPLPPGVSRLRANIPKLKLQPRPLPVKDNVRALDDMFSKLFPDPFIAIAPAAGQAFSQEASNANEIANRDCKIIRMLVKSYFHIVRKALQDSVPKAIIHSLVNYVKDEVQSELIYQLFRSEGMEDMLQESPNIASRRQIASNKLQALTRANELICEIRETPIECW